jgi:hypothetical protein
MTPREALLGILREPAWIVRHWNWKSAILSSMCRAAVFFAANLSAGLAAAFGALGVELGYRVLAAGIYGALTERCGHITPARSGLFAALVFIPGLAHTVEYVVHALAGTPKLGAGMLGSVAFSCITTAFNLFAMRHGAFIVGDGRGTLASDMRRLPALIIELARIVGRGVVRAGSQILRCFHPSTS